MLATRLIPSFAGHVVLDALAARQMEGPPGSPAAHCAADRLRYFAFVVLVAGFAAVLVGVDFDAPADLAVPLPADFAISSW
jgi:hypothetical protein